VVERYILYYYYMENNYTFRRVKMAIFRLYTNHLIRTYTNIYIYIYIYIYMGHLYGEGGGWGGVKWARDLVFVRTVGACGMHGGFMLLSSYV